METSRHVADLVSERWPVVSAALAACAIAFFLPGLLRALRLWGIPVVGEELGGAEKRRQAYLQSAKDLYREGYSKFKDGVFNITTSRKSPVIVLSPKYLPELRKLPDDVVSFARAIDESMHTKYTKISADSAIIPHTVKAELTPALNRINPTLAHEVSDSLDQELPSPARDWTPVHLNKALLRIVARASGRVFIGPELSRGEDYLDAAINYTVDLMAAQRAVSRLRPWTRPFLAARLPEVRRLDDRIRRAHAFLGPVVRDRLEAAARGDAGYQKPDDMLQWLMDNRARFPDEQSRDLARVQLGISFAAIHTTTMTATNAFYDLAATPGLAAELREEARQALADNEGVFSTRALQAMKKMDSLLKETLRFRPMSQATFQRKVLRPLALSSGRVLPAGVIIEIPQGPVSADPDVFEDPDTFDPLRFYRLRQAARDAGQVEGAAQNQFVSVSQSGLTFGYGRHACPGRFFAANEIKMILANAVLKYDVKLADGQTERYPNLEFANSSIPDPSKTLLFKSIA